MNRPFFWLASYPRSGSTWLRFLIAAAYRGPVAESAAVARAVPDIHAQSVDLNAFGDMPAIVKTHWSYRTDLPLPRRAAGAICLIRDPVAVMQSALRHAILIGTFRPGFDDLSISDAVLRDRIRQWASAYLRDGGLSPETGPGYGSWRHHIESWCIGDLPWPRLVLRYEDLRTDTASALARIADFVGWPLSQDRIERAVSDCRPERLRAMEEREMSADRPALFGNRHAARKERLGLRFVDSANAPGAARFVVPDDLAATFRGAHADLMRHFGYR